MDTVPLKVRTIFLFPVILAAISGTADVAAQVSTVSGYVEDAISRERIHGAAIYVPALETGVTSNQYGFYSLRIDRSHIRFVVSHMAYDPVPFTLTLSADTTLLILMTPRTIGLEEVEVVAEGETAVEAIQMSVHDVQIRQLESLPVLLGEVDIQKTLQLLPGVQAGTEGTSGLHVRGGRPDQNLVLMDGVPLYNPAHIFGFLSVFNAPAMKRVEFIKGAFPARYGGRLSSVVNYTMKEGNLRAYAGEASIGLLASRIMLEGPIRKDKASFVLAGRRSYLDAIAAPFIVRNDERPIFYFNDLNVKANAILSSRDRIYLSGFASQDRFGIISKDSDSRFDASINWHNRLVSLRWNHQFSDRLFANTMLGATNYELLNRFDIWEDFSDGRSQFTSTYRSEIVDWISKADFEYAHSLRHYFRFGAEATVHHFNPGTYSQRLQNTGSLVEEVTTSAAGKLRSTEFAVYGEDETQIGAQLRISAGIRFSTYVAKGKTYAGVEPRVAANYRFSETLAAKASWAWATQYVHLLTTGAITLPTDIWVPTMDDVKPQRGYQAALGMVRTLGGSAYELSVEAYFKRLGNYLEYAEGAGIFESASLVWTDLVEVGRGGAYGMEVFLQKKSGRFTGWLAYTLAKATRTFEKLNRGKSFADGFDRRHDIAVVGQYNLSRRVLVSGNWIFGSGYPISAPVARFKARSHLDNRPDYLTTVHYGPINSSRMPASHRLDVSTQVRFNRSWGRHAVTLGIYNIYARQNPTFVFSEIENDEIQFKQISVFRLVPSVSYQIHY